MGVSRSLCFADMSTDSVEILNTEAGAVCPMETHSRSLAKALSWRVTAWAITTLVAWTLTGRPGFALAVGLADSMVKIFAYYSHERLWNRVGFGRAAVAALSSSVSQGRNRNAG